MMAIEPRVFRIHFKDHPGFKGVNKISHPRLLKTYQIHLKYYLICKNPIQRSENKQLG